MPRPANPGRFRVFDFLLALLYIYLFYIAVVGSIALYGKIIDKISEKSPERGERVHAAVMKALRFALVVGVFVGIATGWIFVVLLF